MAEENMLQADEVTSIDNGVYFWVATDPSGTPILKRIKADNLMKTLVNWRGFLNQSSDPSSPSEGFLMYSKSGKPYIIQADGTVIEVTAGNVNPGTANLRLSLNATDPKPLEDLTAKNILYAVEYKGNKISLYDPTAGVYIEEDQPSNFYLYAKSTDRTGDTTNGSNQITNFNGNWRHVTVGYKISGSNIPAATTVTAVDLSTNTITMSANATADGTGVTLTLSAPADTRWDVFAWYNDGAIELYWLKWTSLTARATTLVYGDGHYYLSGAQKYKYLGNFIVTDTDGELEWSAEIRGIFNDNALVGGQYILDKASGITLDLTGGWMSTAEKQAASWSNSGEAISGGSLANVYDGDTSTALQVADQNPTYIKIDFGSDIVFDEIQVYQHPTNGNVRFDIITIHGSTTGAWAGEETQLATNTSCAGAISTTLSFTAAQYRYWRITFDGDGTSLGCCYEINFHYGTTLAIFGVPMGCKVEIWDDTVSKGSEISENLIKPGLVEFEDALTGVDKITITRPDGSTTWLEFAISPSTGDIYSLFKDE